MSAEAEKNRLRDVAYNDLGFGGVLFVGWVLGVLTVLILGGLFS